MELPTKLRFTLLNNIKLDGNYWWHTEGTHEKHNIKMRFMAFKICGNRSYSGQ